MYWLNRSSIQTTLLLLFPSSATWSGNVCNRVENDTGGGSLDWIFRFKDTCQQPVNAAVLMLRSSHSHRVSFKQSQTYRCIIRSSNVRHTAKARQLQASAKIIQTHLKQHRCSLQSSHVGQDRRSHKDKHADWSQIPTMPSNLVSPVD